jgi:hypothetical protein
LLLFCDICMYVDEAAPAPVIYCERGEGGGEGAPTKNAMLY